MRRGVLLEVLLGDARRHPASSIASVLAIAAGVAVFVAIHLAGSAAHTAFVNAVEAVAGRATHEITRPGGLSESRIGSLLDHPAVESAHPLVTGQVTVLGRDVGSATEEDRRGSIPLVLLGIDPFLASRFHGDQPEAPLVTGDDLEAFLTEPGTALVSEEFAREAAVETGDRLRVLAGGQETTLRVIGRYSPGMLGEAARDTALVDIATAQEVLGRVGSVDRIDLVVRDDRASEIALEPGESLGRPSQRGARVARMIEAFRLNLVALGGLALVVGALLVFSAAQFTVVRRSRLLGQLRCLGATRKGILTIALAEVGVLGTVGGLLGLGIGAMLARGLVSPVAQTVSDLYGFVRPEAAPLDAATAAIGLLGAVAAALIAGWFPAIDAARTAPREVGSRTREESGFRSSTPRRLVVGTLAAVAGILSIAVPARSFWPGFVAALAFLLSATSLLPLVMSLTLPALRRLGERTGALSLALAAGTLERSLGRAGGSASALAVALSMTVGVIVMVFSFELEVRRWIGDILHADLYVSDDSGRTSTPSSISAEAVSLIRNREGVESVDTRESLEVVIRDHNVLVLGFDWSDPAYELECQTVLEQVDDPLAALESGGILVSEPLARRFDLSAGQSLSMPTRDGERDFEIAAVVRDYARDGGVVTLLSAPYRAAFGATGAQALAVHVTDGFDAGELARDVRAALAESGFLLRVRSNAELRRDVFVVFDRTFAVTYVLQAIATVMALVGIAVTLVGLFLERAREVATLRAIGSSVRTVTRLFAGESLLLAAYPILAAAPVGALLAWILVHVVNLRSFGWTIRFAWPWGPVLGTQALAALAALMATTIPWILARRQSIALSLREE